jgi:hypothetical protein
VAERFETCGDYTRGIARIQCSNPQGVRLIRYFGLYYSRCRRCSCPPKGWRWPDWEHILRHAPRGYKEAHGVMDSESSPQPSSPSVPESSCRSAWTRLISKVYEIDPLGGSSARSALREPFDLSPMLLPNAHSCRHHRPGRGKEDPPPSGEDRSSASQPGSLDVKLTVVAISVDLSSWGRGSELKGPAGCATRRESLLIAFWRNTGATALWPPRRWASAAGPSTTRFAMPTPTPEQAIRPLGY